MFASKSVIGAGRSRAFMGGAGAEIFLPEAGAKKKKIFGSGAEENGSAPQHCTQNIK